MFTGIVEEKARVTNLRHTSSGYELTVHCKKVLEGTKLGDSIATNGVCLTVTRLGSDYFSAGVSPETLKRSNLKHIQPGAEVNLERAVTPVSRLGGHFVQGHVDAEGKIHDLRREKETLWVTLKTAPELMKYVVKKGFICLDGASLTVVETGEDWFNVMLVSFTQSEITLASKKNGDSVNIEVDILGKYVEKLLSSGSADHASEAEQGVTQLQKKEISQAFLSENGFF